MTDKEIFISRVEEYGGIYLEANEEFSFLEKMLDIHKEIYNTLYPQWKLPDVFMGLINNDDFKAFSFKEQDRYFIALSTGTIRVLKNLFRYVIQQEVLYKDNLVKECKNPMHFNSSFDKIIMNFYRYDLNFDLNDEKSIKQADQLLLKSLELIMMHEFGHIKNGHLDYNKQTDKKNLLFEEDRFEMNKKNIRKVLEYDADISSMNCILRRLHITFNNSEDLINEIIELNYALAITFKAMGMKNVNIDNFENALYPEASYRILYSRAASTSFFNNEGIDESLKKKIKDEVTNHIIKAEQEIPILLQYRFIDDGILDYASNTGILSDYLLSTTYNNIQEELQKYSFVKLPPKSKIKLNQKTFDRELLQILRKL
ncbi:hypothetical protein KQ41_15945 [Lysinibacillus fusiformis]|uniref:hypothetical protein n=1 Tax=Lysinibacillus fusiformis TaxID=28031 RepID=UPI00050136E8|nr:hypothetical protein [Lysinibacillus fusiformis]KGA80372.1 hypothetical protein KQ41_15945 [Lysinibacillus fusiformis]